MPISDVEIHELTEQPTAVIRTRITMQETQRVPELLQTTYEAVQRAGLQPSGPPILRTLSMADDGMEIEIGWPVATPFTAADDLVVASSLPGGPAATLTYLGPYEGIAPAYEALQTWCAEHGREVAGPPWEVYFTDPQNEPDPARWRTDVYFPVRG